MRERRAGLRNNSFRPMYSEAALAFLKFTIVLILSGSATFLFAILIFVPEQTGRAFGPVGTALVGLAAWHLLRRGKIEAAVPVLAFGFWAVATFIAVFNGGMSNMAILYYPMVILILGWMVGTRAAVTAAALSTAATLGFALAETAGILPQPFPTPPVMRLIIQSLVYVFSAILIVYFVRSYQSRLNQVNELSLDLNRAQAVANVGSWVYDLESDSMHLSAETCRIFGLPEGVKGNHDSYLARVHPDDRERVDAAWQAAHKGGAPFDNVHRILIGDTVRWIRQRAEFEFRDDGRPRRSVGTTQDITERKQAEEALLGSEERFRTLLQEIPNVAVQGYGLDGTTQYWNRASERLYGFSAQEAVGRNLLDLIIPPEMRDGVKGAIAQMTQTGQSIPASELSLLRKDGTRVPVYSSHALVHAPGRPPELFCIDVDLTEIKRAEEKLSQQQNLLNTIIESSSEAIFAKDAAGRYCSINEAGARMLGRAEKDVIGHSDMELLPAQMAKAFRQSDERVMSSGEAYESEEAGTIGGKSFTFLAHKAPWRDNSGRVVGVIGVSNDITERKRAEAARAEVEAQLRESQKMEALGTLAGGIAHDFNNIVAAIIGNVELARQDVGSEHPALESLEEIHKASRRAKDLVQQILAFGRRQVLERKVISLAPTVHESARLLRSTLPAGVNLEVECAPDAPAVLADATQIEQVLLNLCSNAWQAMQSQTHPGAIGIRLETHRVGGSPYRGPERRTRGARVALRPGTYACLTVSDNGPGMDQATRSRIFEPFFTTKPEGEGTGLGLAVVHGIVQRHDGSIVVRSAPGEGATFRIYFPAAQEQEALNPAPGAGTQDANGGRTLVLQGEGKHVLYLDDDEAIVFLMTRLLQRQGYRVSSFTDAREAIAAVRAKPGGFDLVVTDFNMPGMSGLEVARALKEIRADLPVALASGYITEELRAKAPAAGVSELIYKPDTAEDFCQTVARLVNSLPG